MSMSLAAKFSVGGVLTLLGLALASVAAMLTHVISTFLVVLKGGEAVWQAVAVLLVGLVIPILGVLHGVLIWFGLGF